MIARFSLVTLLVASGCGRVGFDSHGNDTTELSEGSVPFPGAVAASVNVDETRAYLERAAGFAVQQTRLDPQVVAASASGIGDRIYLAGGAALYPERTQCTDRIVAYDPVTDQITAEGVLSANVQGLRLAGHPDGDLFLIQGYCDGESSEEERAAYRIPPSTLAATRVGLFSSTSYHNAGGILSGPDGYRLVSVGGYGTGPVKDLVQILDPEDGSATLSSAPLPFPRCLAASAVSGGVLFVIGGNTNGDQCRLPTSADANPAVDEIVAVTLDPEETTVVAHLPEPVAGACAVARADGTILIFGGARYADDGVDWNRELSRSVWVFDPTLESVSVHPAELPAPRAGQACGRTENGEIVLFGGADASLDATDEIWLFEPYVAEGTLTGEEIDSGHAGATWTRARSDLDTPPGTDVALSVRARDETEGWSDPEEGWITVPIDGTFPSPPRGSHLQWRLRLQSTNPALTPVVRSIHFEFEW